MALNTYTTSTAIQCVITHHCTRLDEWAALKNFLGNVTKEFWACNEVGKERSSSVVLIGGCDSSPVQWGFLPASSFSLKGFGEIGIFNLKAHSLGQVAATVRVVAAWGDTAPCCGSHALRSRCSEVVLPLTAVF